MRFALNALGRLPRSKISVEANHVTVTAMTDSAEAKHQTEQALRRAKPDELQIDLEISAPRPVITPFTLRYVLSGDEGRFDACSADTEESRARIIRAARDNGRSGSVDCTLGLGVPTTRWAEAAELSMAALTRLGGGTITLSDADISLIAEEGTDQGRFDQTVGELENALPEVFALTAVLPETPDESSDGPPEFSVTRSPEGHVNLRGRVSNEIARQTAESYAKAAFTGASVQMAARIDETLPATWPVRTLAGIEALARWTHPVRGLIPTTWWCAARPATRKPAPKSRDCCRKSWAKARPIRSM